jgi:acyl-coenzyme A thioesterase PaaI-like protein
MREKVGTKDIRREKLTKKLKDNPFMTDGELAEFLNVSVPTIRLDRIALAIPELRERIKSVAAANFEKVKSIIESEFVGDLIDIELGIKGISILQTTKEMAFGKSNIIRGHYIYSMAECLAIAIIDARVALVGIANIKYKVPVYSGAKLIAKGEVKRIRESHFEVWVKIYESDLEIFRGKFILATIMAAEG